MITCAAFLATQLYNKDISVGVTRSTSIAPPLSISPTSSFKVSIFNGTKNAVKFLNEENSWGYAGLSFTIKDPAGHEYKVSRKKKKFPDNKPLGENLDSTGILIKKIAFDDKTWQGMPSAIAGQVDGWQLRVNLIVPKKEILTKNEFWTGEIHSKWYEATMIDRAN